MKKQISRRYFLGVGVKTLGYATLVGAGAKSLIGFVNESFAEQKDNLVPEEHVLLELSNSNADVEEKKQELRLFDLSKPTCLNEPILHGGYFTWGHALVKNGFVRIPKNGEVIEGVYRGAELLEGAMKYLSIDPNDVIITSWYRRPEDNHGARHSKHLEGIAIDHSVKGMSLHELHRRVEPFLTEFTNGKGGLKRYWNFIHMDCREDKWWRG